MASPYIFTNADMQYVNCAGQEFNIYMAFLNPVNHLTFWTDLNLDSSGNWQPPGNTDTLYSQQAPYATTINMGPNRIGFVNEPLYFDGSRSCQRFDLPAHSDNLIWQTFTDNAAVTTYNNGWQAAITWSSPGLYTVAFLLLNRYNIGIRGFRQVMIYQDRASALPGLISISGLSGSISNGGWQFQCTTTNTGANLFSPDSLDVGTYQPVVVMAETRYEVAPGQWVNRTIGPHGLFSPGYPYVDPRILFDGYIQNGTVHQDADKDTLSFSCVGPQMVLQESKSHQLGYYNCSVATYNSSTGQPQSLNASPVGNGFQVGGLMTADVTNSLLEEHSTFSTYHDIHCWNANIPTQGYSGTYSLQASYNLVYTTLSVNEGTIWQNLQDLASNEYAQVYCERDGSIRIGPQVNYRGSDYWNQPTLLGPTAAPYLINIVQDLGYSVGSDLTKMTQNIPQLPAQPIPIQFVHPWGHHVNPPQILQPFGDADTSIQGVQSGLVGPPVLCAFSDTPIYDTGASPPGSGSGVLFPWVANSWPQDLAIYPISMDIQENYTGRASLVKLIGTLYGHNSLWSSWYPQNTFRLSGDGTVSTVTYELNAGDWVLNESHVLADITSIQNSNLVWNWWWEIARREYYARNTNYNMSVLLGMFTGASLGDIVTVTRQNISLGPTFNGKLFYITEISHNIDLTARTWNTELTLAEVTSARLGPIQAPPGKYPIG